MFFSSFGTGLQLLIMLLKNYASILSNIVDSLFFYLIPKYL